MARAAILTIIVVTLLLAFHVDDAIELPVRDVALSMLPSRPAQATVVIAIDEQSLRDVGRWPWSRTQLAEIINRAADAGARSVVLDILLPESAPGDDRLAQALRRNPSVVACVLDEHGRWLLPTPSIREAATPAHGNFELDHDGIVRRFATTKQSGELSLAALSVEASGRPVAVGRTIAPMFRSRPRSIPVLSAGGRDRPLLRDKIVFIGLTANGLGDRFLTPVSTTPDPGVTVHAAATESILRGEQVREPPPILAGGAAGLTVASLIRVRKSRRLTFSVALGLALLIAAGGLLLLGLTGFAVPFVVLLWSILIAAATIEAIRMSATITRLTIHRTQEAESKRVLAHELKTPIASMRGLSQLLAGFDLSDEERRRVASLLESEAGKLQSMVTGLLDLERLPLRDFEASSSVIDLGAVVAARVEFLRASSDRTLTVSNAPGVLIRADAALIDRVVDNLVGNAMKYTSSPIAVTVRRRGAEGVLEVEDRGSGIDEAERARIFDRFFRGSAAAGTEGLGLGLSLVAEVARWHGGSASVHSATESGSLFRVAFPLAPAVAKAGAM
ncbi:MAG TPA: CHASE2 domain-containing protein [Thermoanaerobaculia bacterium]